MVETRPQLHRAAASRRYIHASSHIDDIPHMIEPSRPQTFQRKTRTKVGGKSDREPSTRATAKSGEERRNGVEGMPRAVSPVTGNNQII
jgi:hypothetical protein